MATPKRPVVLRFRLGKGLTKSRAYSQDTSRAVVEQVMVHFAEDKFEQARDVIRNQVTQDVRAELINVMKLFRKYILGRGGTLPKPTGVLSTVSKGSYNPTESLNIPKWAPRSAKYLKYKESIVHHRNWFEFDRNLERMMAPARDQFAAVSRSGGGGVFSTGSAGNQTLFENIFGPISVTLIRNNRGWGADTAAFLRTSGARHLKLQLGTLRVNALGSLTKSMLQMNGGYNTALMGLVERYDPEMSYRLGNRWHYRPSLEPFLAFFWYRAIPQAVTERLRRGVVGASLFRT